MSLFSELKRRNVFRVGAAYLVSAWLLIEIADILFPAFGFPAGAIRWLIILLGLGVLPVLAFSWAYELTAQGLVRDRGPGVEPAEPVQTARRLDQLTIVVMLLALGVVAMDRYVLPRSTPEPAPVGRTPAIAAVQSPGADSERSIAVLPFADMSPDKDQAYFSDGIAEELLNALVKLPGLKVAGRTSSFAFRDRQTDLREIGRALGVSHILEGSVRRAGGRVRITTQLIQAHDGFHVWSETYDREMADIFALQDEITAAVVAALKVELGAGESPRVPVAELEAYPLYLEARQKLARRGTKNLEEARALFEQAIARDPDFAPAHAGLGRAITLLATYSEDAGVPGAQTPAEMSRTAKAAAQRALAIDPDNAEAWSVLGACALWFDWDWVEAERALERSAALRPNDAEIVNFLGDYYARVFDPRAEATERRATELDPLHAVNHHDMALVRIVDRRYEAALEAAATADALGFYAETPEALFTTVLHAQLALRQFDEAARTARRIESLGAAPAIALSARLRVALATGDAQTAQRLLEEITPLAEAGGISPAWMAMNLVEANRPREAAPWFRRAISRRVYSIIAPRLFRVPEDLPDDPALRAALDTPELDALFEIRRRHLRERNGERP